MWRLDDIEPESLDYGAMRVKNGGYALRPEIVESTYYLHHYTGDPHYRAMGRELAEAFKYYYLLFAPKRTLDFDSVVFNTEAHPLRRDRP